MLRVTYDPTICPREQEYVLEQVLGGFLGLPYELVQRPGTQNVSLTLADSSLPAQIIMPSLFFKRAACNWLHTDTVPEKLALKPSILPGTLTDDIVVFLWTSSSRDIVKVAGNQVTFGIDLFGTVFFLLSRYEEAASTATDSRDDFGRFRSAASLAGKYGMLLRPIVDEYVNLLWAAIRSLWPRLLRRSGQYEVRPTHDVDRPWTLPVHSVRGTVAGMAADVIKRHSAQSAFTRLLWKIEHGLGLLDASFPGNCFRQIMEESEQHGLRSCFYFFGEPGHDPRDATYELRGKWITNLIREITDRGHEVGLHPGFSSMDDDQALGRAVKGLRHALNRIGVEDAKFGARQHYLRWDALRTWPAYEREGLVHDASVGFADNAGFRAGTSHTYRAYDLFARRELNLTVRPLHIMDRSLFASRYMALDDERALKLVGEVARACRRHGGALQILWHNTDLLSADRQRFYQTLLEVATTA